MPKSIRKPVLAITVGDFNGIGPEVALKSLNHPAVKKACYPLLVGPKEVFDFYNAKFRMRLKLVPYTKDFRFTSSNAVPVMESSVISRSDISPGKLSELAGLHAAHAIEWAISAAATGKAHGIVTAPVSKQALHLADYGFPGQTEMIQHLSRSSHVAMMLVSKTMRVGLVTIHVPIRKVSEMISRRLLLEKIEIVHDALRSDWKIRSPKLAVLGLNPHASEGGDIGREDIDVVAPVVQKLRQRRMRIEGPFPADSFFGKYKPGMYDAVVAMYHDQGLIPLKMSSFGNGVNVSAGLNIVRTSPDHGTAFDIAGKGTADRSSMVEAIKLAALIAANRGVVRTTKRPKV